MHCFSLFPCLRCPCFLLPMHLPHATQVPELPIGWSDHGSNGPMTLIGSRELQDVTGSVRYAMPASALDNASACMGHRVDQMWNDGIVFCVANNGRWTLAVGGPTLGGAYAPNNIIQHGTLTSAQMPAKDTWHTIALTTAGNQASGLLDDQPIFTNANIRDIDTGFSAIGMSNWVSIQFDDFQLNYATNKRPSHPNQSRTYTVGEALVASDCETNGDIDSAQHFVLRANSWQLYHVASKLCAEASVAGDGATLSLQPCVYGKTEQEFRNDYTNIRNAAVKVTLGAYDKADQGKFALVGTGTHAPVKLSSGGGGGATVAWNTWSYFPNSKQLRNQYNSNIKLGYPQCLSVAA